MDQKLAAPMKLSFKAIGATRRTHVEATILGGKIVMTGGRELSYHEWKIRLFHVQEATDEEQQQVTKWIRNGRAL